jgi:phosphoenolpyruvate-protein phosphotransferase
MPITILAPFDGWCASLDEVPDPVFAGRMLGDGMAVDPTGDVLLAPCDGQIINLPASAHAVSLRTESGLEILVHIGIDTVHLAGRGFEALVKSGAQVHAGEALIRFDLDTVARAAKSLVTPLLLQTDGATIARRHPGGTVRAGDVLFEVHAAGSVPKDLAADASQPTTQQIFVMPLHQGLHARPAALVAQRAKAVQAAVNLVAHGRTANARSVVAIMALGVKHGDELLIQATGSDAAAAIEAVKAGVAEALALEGTAHAPAPSPVPAQTAARAARAGELLGITAVPGFGVGRATRLERRNLDVAEAGAGVEQERSELERARSEVRARLGRMAAGGSATRREIIRAHLEFLDDPLLNAATADRIAAGKSAGFAWRGATRESIHALEQLEDARMRERADDLLDVESHVLMALAGEARPMILPLPERAVLMAADLLPSELTALDRQRLVGICLSGGGATSHVAILAAAMEIPMLVGLGAGLREVAEGGTVIIDADHGRLETAPNSGVVSAAMAKVEARQLKSAEQRAQARADCFSLDGTRIEVFANLGNAAEAAVAVDNGAEGCGLLRTEFLFIDRETAPSESEQFGAYQEIAAVLGDRPLILRLMDVGGDKPLRYLPLPHEDNPALGLRGVRTVLARPDLLRTQLRAALRVSPTGQVRLLLPMVTDVVEILAIRALCEDIRVELERAEPISIGAMIETPAAALTARRLIREVDFLSIGTNDLTQYTLAMDRGHPDLAARTDALHPAVLRLIGCAGDAGAAAGKLVAVCGGMAGDAAAVPVLLGLGVRELSVVPGVVPMIKQRVRGLNLLDCRELALRCLDLSSASEVRALVAERVKGDAS